MLRIICFLYQYKPMFINCITWFKLAEDDRLQETLTIEVVESTNDSKTAENTNSCKHTKKNLNCKSNHENCTNISFRLGSSLRQITIFASKLQYKIGETGNILQIYIS